MVSITLLCVKEFKIYVLKNEKKKKISDMMMEGTVSQICYLGPSLCFV